MGLGNNSRLKERWLRWRTGVISHELRLSPRRPPSWPRTPNQGSDTSSAAAPPKSHTRPRRSSHSSDTRVQTPPPPTRRKLSRSPSPSPSPSCFLPSRLLSRDLLRSSTLLYRGLLYGHSSPTSQHPRLMTTDERATEGERGLPLHRGSCCTCRADAVRDPVTRQPDCERRPDEDLCPPPNPSGDDETLGLG